MANNIGKITQIIGAVLDIKFTEGNLPEINDAIRIPLRGDQGGEDIEAPPVCAERRQPPLGRGGFLCGAGLI